MPSRKWGSLGLISDKPKSPPQSGDRPPITWIRVAHGPLLRAPRPAFSGFPTLIDSIGTLPGTGDGTSNAGTRVEATSVPESVRSRGNTRRGDSRSRSKQTLRAIRNVQVDSDATVGSNDSRARQARYIVSCKASSASKGDPSNW